MKTIKILFSVLIAMAMICSVSFASAESGVAFSADGSVTTIEYSDLEAELELHIYSTVNAIIPQGEFCLLTWDDSKWSWDFATGQAPSASCTGFIVNEFDTAAISLCPDAGKNVTLTAGQELGVVKFTAATSDLSSLDGTAFSINNDYGLYTDGSAPIDCNATITVKIAGPVGPEVSEQPTTATATSKEVVVNDVTYEDVFVAEGTATVTGTITETNKVYIKPLIFDNGVAHGDYAKVLVPGTFTGENPTIGFKIAIIGAPENAVITAGGTITIE